MGSPSSESTGAAQHDRLAARILIVMAVLAVACVVVGMVAAPQLVPLGAASMMLAPLVALGGVAVGAIRARNRLAGYAIGAVLITALGMVLAR